MIYAFDNDTRTQEIMCIKEYLLILEFQFQSLGGSCYAIREFADLEHTTDLSLKLLSLAKITK